DRGVEAGGIWNQDLPQKPSLSRGDIEPEDLDRSLEEAKNEDRTAVTAPAHESVFRRVARQEARRPGLHRVDPGPALLIQGHDLAAVWGDRCADGGAVDTLGSERTRRSSCRIELVEARRPAMLLGLEQHPPAIGEPTAERVVFQRYLEETRLPRSDRQKGPVPCLRIAGQGPFPIW